MRRAFLYLFVMLALQLFVSYTVHFIWFVVDGWSVIDALRLVKSPSPMTHTAEMTIAASVISSVITLVVFIWRKWCVMSPAYLRERQWGVFFWCVVAALGTILPSVYLHSLFPWLPNLMEDTFERVLANDYGYFAICLVAPFVEEVVFRGAILRALLGHFSRHWVAIVVSALLFSVAHFNPAQMPHAFIIALLLGWMYYRTGSILPGVLFHWINNTVAYVMYKVFYFVDTDSLEGMFGNDDKAVVLALVFSLFLLVPALYQLSWRMRK